MPRDYSPEKSLPADHQRRPEYKREDDWIRAFLSSARIARIATSREDQPFVNPSTFWFDEDRHQIVFHSNVAGRVRANVEHNSKVCIEISEMGKVLPSNVALEFSLQYRSVVVFGTARLMENAEEQRRVMHQLIAKYFPTMQAGREFRAVTDQDLKRTSVYAVQIEAWSGKENWKDRADQSDEWPALEEKWFV
jgi:nitroimidazol reductase NimA-like FMN-containing flavoprotein (pyridoxamine 5'-phosphate oxidase superfamily)